MFSFIKTGRHVWYLQASDKTEMCCLYFLPRNAMHTRGLCRHAVSVCLSVCPSITFMYSDETNKHIFKIFFTVG